MTQTVQPGVDAAASWRERDAELVAPAYARYTDLVIESASGARLHTVDGREILDLGSGIGVTNLGHNHPSVVAAVHAQVDRLWHTSVTALHPMLVEAAQAVTAHTPQGLDQVFFCNSGAEAVEGAIKLVRKATGRSEIIGFRGGFHGRTYGAVTLTSSKARYRAGIGPLLPGVHHVTYPDPRTPGATEATLAEIGRLLATTAPASDVAALVVEPVLGEGGYIVPPQDFLPRLRALCDEHGILLVADEVQSGFGRTGRMFAVEHWGVRPDVMCLAKAMANGLPIGAVVASAATMRAWRPGDHGTTFGGNPVSCAATVAVIETIQREGLCARASELGAAVLQRARSWCAAHPALVDVRGLGLMIGLEFRTAEGAPAAALVAALRAEALRQGLLLLSCGVDDNVIRLVPPLTIAEDELEAALGIIERSLVAVDPPAAP